MATPKQIEANRRNAQKSTGPKTPEGKAAIRLNALQHGLTARVAVLPFENAEEFAGLCASLESEWQPQTPTERYHLEIMAVSRWKQARAESIQHHICHSLELAPAEFKMVDQLQKQQGRLQRAHDKAQHELHALLKLRRAAETAQDTATAAARQAAFKAEAQAIADREAAILADADRRLHQFSLQLQARDAAGKSKKQTQSADSQPAPPPLRRAWPPAQAGPGTVKRPHRALGTGRAIL